MQTERTDFLTVLDGSVQYIVPRWQRKYRWGEREITRLIDDILTIANADKNHTHFAGTLLTFEVQSAPGGIRRFRLVDGQQRLTTVSILLCCLANKLDQETEKSDWSAEMLRDRLVNIRASDDKRFKLVLQDDDVKEYWSGIDGFQNQGKGPVSQAWKTMQRIVDRSSSAQLIQGLQRLSVVTLALENTDDPQQIFESINATGQPLTESEKVKNWLLIGLPDDQQKRLHDVDWKQIEEALGATYSTESIDEFLRDVMRWRTGDVLSIKTTFDVFRSWAIDKKLVDDRAALCEELSRLAVLYGTLTGTYQHHSNRDVERELNHLRQMNIDIHRPLTLRMLDDASEESPNPVSPKELSKALRYVSTWITRIWLADIAARGLTNRMTDLAFSPRPKPNTDYAEFWHKQICSLRYQSAGVPNDELVRRGIRTRKAYGGKATQTTFAVLCELMEHEQPGQAPSRDRLTLEHVMPQKLTSDWSGHLGEYAQEVHEKYRHLLANLTLSGDVVNSSMGADSFDSKKKVYKSSSITMTRAIAEIGKWTEGTLEERASMYSYKALDRWPWKDEGAARKIRPASAGMFRWRLQDSDWFNSKDLRGLVLDVIRTILDLSTDNAEKMTGTRYRIDLQPASRFPSKKFQTARFVEIPGHNDWLICSHIYHYKHAMQRVQDLANRCDMKLDVELSERHSNIERFWNCLQDTSENCVGKSISWFGSALYNKCCDVHNNRVFVLFKDYQLEIYCTYATNENSELIRTRMLQISDVMWQQLADQSLSDIKSKNHPARTISIYRDWDSEDEASWQDTCEWILDQYERLSAILADFDPQKRTQENG